ncbi:DNA-binding response regulator, NarL/FixJ family, contains REC and HTH domains [Sphingomonas sp. OV641]|uniref:helix-turn-helix transcriptional regulator n=1 Tax=Sphingomonas sp. OV641 TaxID=1881068 RepID=UPI0008B4538A|nr:LuxR C-terminal-related transcriptional regulator [Sphingomonas sp. OV641]SEJ87086.1 DNA-binding response regulator, NarL/FixJ family, contains REC and HTH domains [Sphingomonas sp. OV641]
MQDALRAVLLCTNNIWREAIVAALRIQNIEVLPARAAPGGHGFAATNDDGPAGADRIPDVALIAADHDPADLAQGMAALPIANWVVIGGQAQQPLVAQLQAAGRSVSLASPALDGRQLAHVAALAALGQPICTTPDLLCPAPHDGDMLDQAGLDEEQWQLMRCLSEGLSNKEIARLHQTSEGAVKARIRVLLSRLGVTNRTQAAVIGARAGLRMERGTPRPRLVFQQPSVPPAALYALAS